MLCDLSWRFSYIMPKPEIFELLISVLSNIGVVGRSGNIGQNHVMVIPELLAVWDFYVGGYDSFGHLPVMMVVMMQLMLRKLIAGQYYT